MDYYEYIIIYLTAVTGMWKALPVGFLLEASPVAIGSMTSLGAVTCVFLIYYGGKAFEKVINRFQSDTRRKRREGKTRKILEKYGTPGLGLLGTLMFGQPVVMIIGLVLVREKKKLLLWVVFGTVLWSWVLTLLGAYGLDLVLKK